MLLLLLLLTFLHGFLTSTQEPPHPAPSQDAFTTSDSGTELFGYITVPQTSENTTDLVTESLNKTIASVKTNTGRNAEIESKSSDVENTTTSRASTENGTSEIRVYTTGASTENTIASPVALTTPNPFENVPLKNITIAAAAENTTETKATNTTTATESTFYPSTGDTITSRAIHLDKSPHTTPAQSTIKAVSAAEAEDTSLPEVFRPQTGTVPASPEITTEADKINDIESLSFWETLKSYFHKKLCY